MIVYFLQDLLFTFLELYAIVVVYHLFVLDFHRIELLGGKVLAEEDLAEGTFAYEVYYLVAFDYLRGWVAEITLYLLKEFIRDAAEVGGLFNVGGALACLESVDAGVNNARSFSIRITETPSMLESQTIFLETQDSLRALALLILACLSFLLRRCRT